MALIFTEIFSKIFFHNLKVYWLSLGYLLTIIRFCWWWFCFKHAMREMIIAAMTRILRFFVNSFCTKGIETKIYYLYFMSCKYSLIDFLIQLSTCLRFKGSFVTMKLETNGNGKMIYHKIQPNTCSRNQFLSRFLTFQLLNIKLLKVVYNLDTKPMFFSKYLLLILKIEELWG